LPVEQARLLDATALDLPDNSFDLVLSGFTLHVLPTPQHAFTEVARVLAPGGALVFSVPGPSADGGWWASYGRVVDEFTRRLPPRPNDGTARTLLECAEHAGLEPEGRWNTEVSFPVEGPEAHWSWLMSHGSRWLHDALEPADRAEFRTQVLRTLREDHPTGGRQIIAGAEFHRYTRP
jgi:SAM-dependent methyltransferase